MQFKINKGKGLTGDVTLPGDKSISHRSIMCAALAEGKTIINGFLMAEDCLNTIDAFTNMGVKIEKFEDKVIVHGVGLYGLKKPVSELYLGNSGTSMRLMSGLLSGQNFSATLTGDKSLSIRPMRRVVDPLTLMGANILTGEEGTPPLSINPSKKLKGILYDLPIASAQVKSSIMFAALYSDTPVTIVEKTQTRNHTELMFKKFGIEVNSHTSGDVNQITVFPPKSYRGVEINIPSDFSSAAFLILAALITPNSNLTLKNIGLNPTRTALIDALLEMGANITQSNKRKEYEPSGDITVKTSKLKSIELNPKIIPNLIDELPVLFIAASLADGFSIFNGLEELRTKESDRLKAMAESLSNLGVKFYQQKNGIKIKGLNQEIYDHNSNLPFQKASINSYGDHRIAMASAIACTRSGGQSYIENTQNVATSFPNFLDVCKKVGMEITT